MIFNLPAFIIHTKLIIKYKMHHTLTYPHKLLCMHAYNREHKHYCLSYGYVIDVILLVMQWRLKWIYPTAKLWGPKHAVK